MNPYFALNLFVILSVRKNIVNSRQNDTFHNLQVFTICTLG